MKPSTAVLAAFCLPMLWLATVPARALTPAFPAKADLNAEQDSALGSYRMPVGPWKDGAVPMKRIEGKLSMRAWRVEKRDLTTMQLMATLRSQIEAQGFAPIFECATDACGGFDFRYAMQILPEPQMHVDLGDFRYLAARRQGADGPQYIGLLVSRSNDAGFVEMVQVGLPLPAKAAPAGEAPAMVAAPAPDAAPATPGQTASATDAVPDDVASALSGGLSVVLDGLTFPSGSSDLAPGDYASLADLAAYMKAHPGQKITLVGHTDAQGGLDANIALSKKRAESVRQRLIDRYGIDPASLSAEGVGYLAPRASNNTLEGREQNRRVEAMVDSTQ